MFTSRAEHRLVLRHDSSDTRLFDRGYELGLHSQERYEHFRAKREGIAEIKGLLRKRKVTGDDVRAAAEIDADGERRNEGYRRGRGENPAGCAEVLDKLVGKSFYHALKSPSLSITDLARLEPSLRPADATRCHSFGEGRSSGWKHDASSGFLETNGEPLTEWLHQVELDVKYEGYVARQERQLLKFQKIERMKIPRDFDYARVPGLSTEAREKFREIRPASVGQAGRIPGVRNSDVAVLMATIERNRARAEERAELAGPGEQSTRSVTEPAAAAEPATPCAEGGASEEEAAPARSSEEVEPAAGSRDREALREQG